MPPASVREALDLGDDRPAPTELRIATWNLRNFPSDGQDLDGVLKSLREIDAPLVAVQEIKKPAQLESRLHDRALIISRGGGRGHQKLGFVYDPTVLRAVGDATEHKAVSVGGRVRPALSQRFQVRGADTTFIAVVVHLKAMPKGADLRRQQWVKLAALVRALGPGPVVVLGDFNPVGGGGATAARELRDLDTTLARAGLSRLQSSAGCSAYWDGPRRDAWKEPSLLDLIYVGGLSPDVALPVAEPQGHCARQACESFRSTKAYPNHTFEHVSDHCPVRADLPWRR